MLETLGLQGACDEALRTARELEPQVGTLVGENEGFGRCSASWSASRTWRDRSSRPGSATLTLFWQILWRIGKLAWYATTPSGDTRFTARRVGGWQKPEREARSSRRRHSALRSVRARAQRGTGNRRCDV